MKVEKNRCISHDGKKKVKFRNFHPCVLSTKESQPHHMLQQMFYIKVSGYRGCVSNHQLFLDRDFPDSSACKCALEGQERSAIAAN